MTDGIYNSAEEISKHKKMYKLKKNNIINKSIIIEWKKMAKKKKKDERK